MLPKTLETGWEEAGRENSVNESVGTLGRSCCGVGQSDAAPRGTGAFQARTGPRGSGIGGASTRSQSAYPDPSVPSAL